MRNNNNSKKNLLECNVCVDLPYVVSRIQDSSKATSASMRLSNIYTPSVFCYDKHKENFDIQFSLKRHETV